MTLDIIVTVVAGLLLALALFGTVFPVVPGSPTAIAALILWGWVLGSTVSWTTAAVGCFFCLIGWSASALLTGRVMKRHRIPKGSILVAVVAGVVGAFLIPFLGLFVGFALGLFVTEFVRQRDFQAALASSIRALKAMGLGMLTEFFMVALAASVWVVGVVFFFAAG
jgi:uncharacterized protein YqgC (DUF456 family)